jgi:3-oxoacyl-[acyl-carrier-protein] synthase-1
MSAAADGLWITGLGMVSAVGYDVVTSCAAARAGIVHARELDCFQLRSPDDGEVESVVGHPVEDLTRGFEGEARLLRLLHGALTDLLRHANRPAWPEGNTGFYLSLADPLRRFTGLELIGSEETRTTQSAAAAQAREQAPQTKEIAERLLEKAARLAGWPGEPRLLAVSTSGQTGVGEMIHQATKDVSSGAVEAAVVGGIDSFLDEDTVAWLQNTGRLKSSFVPAGLQPGEAAAFLVLQKSPDGATPCARTRAVALGEESRSLLGSELSQGQGLTEVLGGVGESAGWTGTVPAWVLSDHNGEPYRASEWGNALVRLVNRFPALQAPLVWYPAASVGETGAAYGAISCCLAVRAFQRGYAPARSAVVLASADGPPRAAVVVCGASD